MKFSNRLEAYTSWKATGVKPDNFDDTPQNITEYWLKNEADRLDAIEGGGPTPPPVGSNDYNDLINKPIEPYPTDRPTIPIEGSEINFEVGMTIHFNKDKEDEIGEWLMTLDYSPIDPDSPPMAAIIGTFDGQQPSNNTLVAAKMLPEMTGLDHDVYLMQYIADIQNPSTGMFFPYSTDEFSIPGMSFKKGVNIEYIDVINATVLPIMVELEPWANDYISLVAALELEEGKYYYKAGRVTYPTKGDLLTSKDFEQFTFDREVFVEKSADFTYPLVSQLYGPCQPIFTQDSPIPSPSESTNIGMCAMLTNMLGEEDEVILYSGFFILYASKHANQTVDMQGMTMHFDEDGWLDTMGTTPFSIDTLFNMLAQTDEPTYFVDDVCNEAFIFTKLADIFKYENSQNKSLVSNNKSLYEHQIYLDAVSQEIYNGETYTWDLELSFNLYTDSSTQFTTLEQISNHLYEIGEESMFDSSKGNIKYPAPGIAYDEGHDITTPISMLMMYHRGDEYPLTVYTLDLHTLQLAWDITSSNNIIDRVIKLI